MSKDKKPKIKAAAVPMSASSFGDVDFSTAFDTGASGILADGYRQSIQAHGIGTVDYSARDASYRNDRLAQKIVTIPVFDSLYNWRTDNLHDDEYGFKALVKEACELARRYNDVVIFPIIVNRKTNRPIVATRKLESIVKSSSKIIKFTIIHENIVFDEECDQDFQSVNYGQPKTVTIGNVSIHPSRLIVLNKNGLSFFESILVSLGDFHESMRRLAIASRRNSAFALSTNWESIAAQLDAKLMATGHATRLDVITQERARSLYKNLNDVNVAILNHDEKLQHFQANNIGDLVASSAHHMTVLSGNVDIPYSRLFSKNSSGIGDNGLETFENYNQSLIGYRDREVTPLINSLDSFVNVIDDVSLSDWEWNLTRAEEVRLLLSPNTTETSNNES